MATASANILIASHVIPWPAQHGNEFRLQRLINWLRTQGHRVILIITSGEVAAERAHLTKRHVDRLVIASSAHRSIQPFRRRNRLKRHLLANLRINKYRSSHSAPGKMKELADYLSPPHVTSHIHAIIAEEEIDLFFAFYAFTLHSFDATPLSIPLVCDTNEVFSLQRYTANGVPITSVRDFTPSEESAMLKQADITLAIQPAEEAYLKQLLPEARIVTVGIDVDIVLNPALPSQSLQAIGILGSDNPLNIEGVAFFLDKVWATIRLSCPHAVLRVGGQLGQALMNLYDSLLPLGVCIVGWVDDLKDFYSSTQIIVNPAIRGTGLKVKTIEALAHARPVVSFPTGLEGLMHPGEAVPWREAADADAMASSCIKLLRDPGLCDSLGSMAHAYICNTYSPDRVYRPLSEILNEIC